MLVSDRSAAFVLSGERPLSCAVTPLLQHPRNVRWIRRSEWLHCLVQCSKRSAGNRAAKGPRSKTHTAAAENGDLRDLLTDQRLARASKAGLVTSVIIGKAASFLAKCCDDPVCPLSQPYGAPEPTEGESLFADLDDDENDDGEAALWGEYSRNSPIPSDVSLEFPSEGGEDDDDGDEGGSEAEEDAGSDGASEGDGGDSNREDDAASSEYDSGNDVFLAAGDDEEGEGGGDGEEGDGDGAGGEAEGDDDDDGDDDHGEDEDDHGDDEDDDE